ncbi:Ribonuclease H-like domain containing protein [Forsythia ovata]|uniref:Ribonuclease H-like domain containing protein n=1 Tax=Forsythia ovata TaxID=205694 RepID=A0ABD1P233_9LAMI
MNAGIFSAFSISLGRWKKDQYCLDEIGIGTVDFISGRVLLWCIWNDRNCIVLRSLLNLEEYRRAQISVHIDRARMASSTSIKWKPPQVGGLKLNTDVSFKLGEGGIGVGRVLRDAQGIVRCCWAASIGVIFQFFTANFLP